MFAGLLSRRVGSVVFRRKAEWHDLGFLSLRNELAGRGVTTLPPLSNDFDGFYSALFYLLKSPKNLHHAGMLHAVLLCSGFFHESSTGRVLCSHLVDLYVTLGNLHSAYLVFELMPKRSNIAWNSMLRGYVGNRRYGEAIDLYHLMVNEGEVPDSYTYPPVLNACSALVAIDEGRSVYMSIKSHPHQIMKHNIYVECALIDMFVKCGFMEEARMVFYEMPKRDLASWTAMICGSLHNKKYTEAFNLFHRFRMDGLQPDYVIVASIFSSLGQMDGLFGGLSLHGYVIKNGLVENVCSLNALMDMHCKYGNIEDAYALFCRAEFKDTISWNTIITGYVRSEDCGRGLKIFVEMVRLGLSVNAITVASVVPALSNLVFPRQGKEMHSYVIKHGLGSDTVLGSAFIEMYSKCGLSKMADCVYRNMQERDVTILNSMILACKYDGNLGRAFKFFREIWESKLRPNFISLISVIPLCARLGIFTQGKEIHCYAMKEGMTCEVSVCNCIIDMYCKSGHLQLGKQVFDGLFERNIVTYNSIIHAYGIHGHAESAFSLFNQLKSVGIKPNRVTFVALLMACSHKGLLEKGCGLFRSMVDDYFIEPKLEHYSCMVDLLGRVGCVDDAYYFMKRVPLGLHMDMLASLIGSCRIHNKVNFGEIIGKDMVCNGQFDSDHHVLLSGLYAFDKRWEDARSIKIAMKDHGFSKKPGCSWIQIGYNVHIFHASGAKHPELDKIQEALESLFFGISVDNCFSDIYFNI